MKNQLIPLALSIAVLGLAGSCKKADSSKSNPPGAGNTASGQQSVLLKPKWPVGNRYVYRMDMDQHSTNKVPQLPKPIQQDVTMSMTYTLSVLKETANGGRELAMEFLASEMEARMGDQVILSFDSKEGGKGGAPNPMAGPLQNLIGSKLGLSLGPDGKVEQVIGLDEWVSKVTGDGAGPMGQTLSQQFNEGFIRQMADMGRMLSANPVSVGQSWPFKLEFPSGTLGKIAVDATIALKGWEEHEQHHCAILDSRGTLKLTPGKEAGPMGKITIDQGKLLGRTWFDSELGAMIESSSDQGFRVKGEIPNPQGGKQAAASFTSDIGQKVTVKLVELTKNSS